MSPKAKAMVHVVLAMALAIQVLGVTLLASGYTGGHDTIAFCTWFVLEFVEPPIVFFLASEAPDAGDGGTGEARQ